MARRVSPHYARLQLAKIWRMTSLINPEKGLHVTALLPILLPVKSLTINDVIDVSPFLDLCVSLSSMAIFDHKSVVRWWRKTESRGRRTEGGDWKTIQPFAFSQPPC